MPPLCPSDQLAEGHLVVVVVAEDDEEEEAEEESPGLARLGRLCSSMELVKHVKNRWAHWSFQAGAAAAAEAAAAAAAACCYEFDAWWTQVASF